MSLQETTEENQEKWHGGEVKRLVGDRVIEIVDSRFYIFKRGEEHRVGETRAKERHTQPFVMISHD